jgi:DNA-nicking Smr family endonuclease
MDSENALFLQELDGVQPIKCDKADITKVAIETPGIRVRRKLAEAHSLERDPLSSAEVPLLKSNDVLEYKRPGIQNGVYRKFRLGQYDIEARLDLHKLTIEQARKEVFRFLSECMEYELRTVMILHGKGDRNPDKVATLKSHIAVWLPQIDEVMAFHSAQRHHGGTGAVYIMLKKGDRAKQNNREKHGMR